MRHPLITSPLAAHIFLIIATFLNATHALTVKPGDTFAKIAAEQGVSIATLMAANPGVAANNLQPDQVLNVPSASASPSSTTTMSSSTSSFITSTTGKKITRASPKSTSTTPSATPTPSPPPVVSPEFQVAPPICAPAPIGPYSDAANVEDKTDPFCDNNGNIDLAQLVAAPYNGILSGDSQEGNTDHGNGGLASNENGYNMSISAVPNCQYPDDGVNYTIGFPVGPKAPVAWQCRPILTGCWAGCTDNKGMGGIIVAGCFQYVFHADP